jgi:hypothetical protein
MFFKYINSAIFFFAMMVVGFQAIFGMKDKWNNEWVSPDIMRIEM